MVVAGVSGLLLVPLDSGGLPATGFGLIADRLNQNYLPFCLNILAKICQKHPKNAMASILTRYLPGRFEKFAASMTQRFF